MSNKITNCLLVPGKYNNYLIGGNVTNAFAVGDIGSTDDFFIVGIEPEEESIFPLITANILDSEGEILFRLVRNVIVFNPGDCSKIYGDHIGYEIHDSAGELIFKVETQFVFHPLLKEESYITTIEGNFYNNNRELVFTANSNRGNDYIETSTKAVFGFDNGGFGMNHGYTSEELDFLMYIFSSKGKINQPIRGKIENQKINLDGKALQSAHIKGCEITITEGDFILINDRITFEECNFMVEGQAKQLVILMDRVRGVGKEFHL